MAKKGSNGGGISKTYDPAKEAAARKAAQERKKRAAGGRTVHDAPNLNRGTGSAAKAEYERKQVLAAKRAEQADAALAMMPALLPGESGPAHQAFAAVLEQFRTAQPRHTQNGVRVGATQVAIEKAKATNPRLFRHEQAEAGVKAAKTALWRANTPDWEKKERYQPRPQTARTEQQTRRKTSYAVARQKAVPPVSPERLAELQARLEAADLNLRLAQTKVSRQPVSQAKQALNQAQQALERATGTKAVTAA